MPVIQLGFPGGAIGKGPACQGSRHKEISVPTLGLEDPLDEGMATHYRILGRRIPRIEEPGGLQFLELQRVGHE